MKKMYRNNKLTVKAILFGVCGLFATDLKALDMDCQPVLSCESLGYTKNNNDCSDEEAVKCPYDTSYKKCVNLSCEQIGFTTEDKTSWCMAGALKACPTDKSYTLCAKPCGCPEGSSYDPESPYGRMYTGDDGCGKACYGAKPCPFDDPTKCVLQEIEVACEKGYAKNVEDCGSSGSDGWMLQGDGECKLCISRTCESYDNSSAKYSQNVSECGEQATGWELSDSDVRYAGDNVCKRCVAKTCAYTSAVSGYTCEPNGKFAGDTPCYSCTHESPNCHRCKISCDASDFCPLNECLNDCNSRYTCNFTINPLWRKKCPIR